MKIIILGAGQVGGSLAENLSSEANDITVVDTDEARLRELRDRLDIGVVSGAGSHPDVLMQAGIEDADMLVAVTNNDETNMIACQVAHSLFRTPTKIARVRQQLYLREEYAPLFSADHMPIDVIISPELEVAKAVARRLLLPGKNNLAAEAEELARSLLDKVGLGGHAEAALAPHADAPPSEHLLALCQVLRAQVAALRA